MGVGDRVVEGRKTETETETEKEKEKGDLPGLILPA